MFPRTTRLIPREDALVCKNKEAAARHLLLQHAPHLRCGLRPSEVQTPNAGTHGLNGRQGDSMLLQELGTGFVERRHARHGGQRAGSAAEAEWEPPSGDDQGQGGHGADVQWASCTKAKLGTKCELAASSTKTPTMLAQGPTKFHGRSTPQTCARVWDVGAFDSGTAAARWKPLCLEGEFGIRSLRTLGFALNT